MPTARPYEPAVALESSVIAQGLPRPDNLETALRVEDVVRSAGAVPRTTGILDGRIVCGLDRAQLERMATEDGIVKASLRDLPVVTARGMTASTTVATTAWIALRHGIHVMATGGLGGVHRTTGAQPSHDVSADLPALATIPITVVCSGPKAILDIEATRERLETDGVTVIGFGTDALPAFWFADSGLRVDERCDNAQEVADIVRSRDRMRTPAAIVVAVPPPVGYRLDSELYEVEIDEALQEAGRQGLRSADVTPFVLSRLRETAGERLLASNIALLLNNAEVAARIALELVPRRPDLV